MKADIRKYFDEVNHDILIKIIKRKIKDEKVTNLITKILRNHHSNKNGKGMPLGNLTSQFFANVYLNELDYFIKHELKIKYYIRYVDDFVILHQSRIGLEVFKERIGEFLNLIHLKLHPDKSKIIKLKQGIPFLGFRIFRYHRLLKKNNIRKMRRKFSRLKFRYNLGMIDYDDVHAVLEGWLAYIRKGRTHRLRKREIIHFESLFPDKIADVEVNRWLKNHFPIAL